MTTTSHLLSARGLVVRLGGADVLRGIDLDIGPGWTALVGPNGAGKSTLLRALSGLLRPAAGEVLLDGRPLAERRAAERARRLAWLAQGDDVTGELTVAETVALGRIAHLGALGAGGAADARAVARAMALTGCDPWASRRLQTLSGGERRRVLLARVLATEAPLLLLDEPTTHLDAPHQVALVRLLQRLAHDRQGPRAVVSVLHDLSLALAADRVIVLAAGRVAAEGAPHDPALQDGLVAVFDHAVRIQPGAGSRPQVVLALDDEAS